MIHARAYRVLDRVAVEITCSHSTEGHGSHFLLREELHEVLGTPEAALSCLHEVLESAAWSAERGQLDGLTDDCGWL